MKFQLALLALPLLAIANPLAEPEPNPVPEALAEAFPEPLPLPALRSSLQTGGLGPRTCKLTGSDLKYRKCPSTNNKKCKAIGQYGKKGTKVALKCWTVGSTVNGYASVPLSRFDIIFLSFHVLRDYLSSIQYFFT